MSACATLSPPMRLDVATLWKSRAICASTPIYATAAQCDVTAVHALQCNCSQPGSQALALLALRMYSWYLNPAVHSICSSATQIEQRRNTSNLQQWRSASLTCPAAGFAHPPPTCRAQITQHNCWHTPCSRSALSYHQHTHDPS